LVQFHYVLHGQNDDKTTAYSSLLSDEAAVYEVIIEDVKPREWENYLKHKGDCVTRVDPKTMSLAAVQVRFESN